MQTNTDINLHSITRVEVVPSEFNPCVNGPAEPYHLVRVRVFSGDDQALEISLFGKEIIPVTLGS